MAVPMKFLLLDPLNNEWGNGLVAINKMRGEMIDFPDDWETGVSDKTGTSSMQSFVIYKNEVYDIVKNYYDMDNKVRIFMCIKSREPYDNEELWNAQKPSKKDDTTTTDPSTPKKPLLTLAKESLATGFVNAGISNSSELATMAANDLAVVYDTGTLNYKLITPNYRDETSKIINWRKSVADGEETDAITYYDYRLTQSINTLIDAGMTYQVTESNVNTICGTRTKTIANLIKIELENYSKDATFELGGSVVEVNGKIYVGWIAKVSLPHVAKTKKDPLIDRSRVNLTQAFHDSGKKNDEELAAKITKYLNTVKDGKINMNVVDPLESIEQEKLGKWMTAVENKEHADFCSITIYTLTDDLDLDTNVGHAYEVVEDTVSTLPYDKTKSFIDEQTESAMSISDDVDITFAGAVAEVSGKVYIGWAITIDLPEVAEVIPSLTERAAPKIDAGISDAGFTNNAELAAMVTTALNKIDASGNLNLNNVTPLEEDEIVKLSTWSAAVDNGEHADACSIITYTIVTDLDTDANSGPAYELTEDTLESLAYTKSKSVAEENHDNATSLSENATYAIGGAVSEVNGKTYIGWAIKIGLPEVAAKASTNPTEPTDPDAGNTDSGEKA